MTMKRALLLFFIILSFSSCSYTLNPPELAGIYHQAASNVEHGNPIIVIPGILGSKLEDNDSGKVVWGGFGPGFVNPNKTEGARLFALPIEADTPLRDLRDEVKPKGVLDRLKIYLFGLPLELQAYAQILETLGAGGYKDETLGQAGAIDYGDDHFTCFQFDYDWRRDIVENAKRFEEFLIEKRAFVRMEYEERYGKRTKPIKFDVVAHSMGGLLLRYYLRYGGEELEDVHAKKTIPWTGAKHIEKALFVGTPSGGSIMSMYQLIFGVKFSNLLPVYRPAIIGTFPSVYQLLPRARHHDVQYKNKSLDVFDVKIWDTMGWGLLNPKEGEVLETLMPHVDDAKARREVAKNYLERVLKRAKNFHEVIDRPAKRPEDLDLYLFLGDAMPTPARLTVGKKSKITHWAPGDGTVTRRSALMDERNPENWRPHLQSPIDWSDVSFHFADHVRLTQDPAFSDKMLYLLLEAPR